MPLIDPRAGKGPIHARLAALVRALEKNRVPYAFTGSFSQGFWSPPRASKDIDVVLLLDPDRSKRRALLDDVAASGFEVLPDALSDLERVHSTPLALPLPTGKVIVELLVAEPEREKLTRRIVGRAKTMEFPGLEEGVKVVTPEDLLVYKLLLFRDGSTPFQTDDLKDMQQLLATRGNELDISYVFLSLTADESLPANEIGRRKRWLQKTLAALGIKRR